MSRILFGAIDENYFNCKRFRVRLRFFIYSKLKVPYKSWRNWLFYFLFETFPSKKAIQYEWFERDFGQDYYFLPTKEKITLKNINFFPDDIKLCVHPKEQIRQMQDSVKIWNELAATHKKDWVYCEDREFKTDYEEKAKYQQKQLDKLKKQWSGIKFLDEHH